MKKLLLLIAIIFSVSSSFAQCLNKISFVRDGSLDFISFALDGNVFIYVTKDGNIKKWGYDRFTARGQENYADELDAYVGKTDYYTQNDDAAFRGKVKYIGGTLITYYASYDDAMLQGKIKSIGNITIEYYQSYENESFKGNIKTVGQHSFSWYGSFDNAAYRGKLKSVGPTTITYYGSSDDKIYSGRIKSVGSMTYTWYGSFDRNDYRGAMKSGNQWQTLNTIKFYVRS